MGLLLCPVTAFGTSFNDTFDSIDSGWMPDRFDPAGFVVENFDGDNRLKISISDADSQANRPSSFSSAFYNTQGRQRAVGEGPDWKLSGELFISDDMLSGNNLRRTDLWGRTGTVGTETGAKYPIIGVARFDPNDPFNPAAPNIETVLRVWDDETGGWVILPEVLTSGWHELSISGDGTSFSYELDGSVVYTDLTINPVLPDLTAAFVQAFNFGAGDYDVYWDNIRAGSAPSIPEPTTVMLLVGGLVGVGFRRRRLS